MTPESRQAMVGGAVMLVLALVLGGSYGGASKKASAAAGGYYLSASFNKVDGLAVGDEVRVGGIRVGRVAEQTLGQDYRAIVRLWLKSGLELPADTSAAIHTDGLFGSKYVILEPGGDEQLLENGDSLEFTQDAVIVGELLEKIIAQGRQLRGKKNDQTGSAGN